MNNSSAVATAVHACDEAFADCAVIVTGVPLCVKPCDKVTYSIVASNNGPLVAENAVVTCHLPSQICGEEYSVDGGCNWMKWRGKLELGELPPGKHVTIMIRGYVERKVREDFSVTSEISSSTEDIKPDNNIFEIKTHISVCGGENCCRYPAPDEGSDSIIESIPQAPPQDIAPTAGEKILSNHTAVGGEKQFAALEEDTKGKPENFTNIPHYVDGNWVWLCECTSTNHIQGYIQFRDTRTTPHVIHYIFTQSHKEQGWIAAKRSDNKDATKVIKAPFSIKDKNYGKNAGWDHPSGIAVQGQYLFVPWSGDERSEIYVYDILDDYRVVNVLKIPHNCVCIAVTDCVVSGVERYLLAVRIGTVFTFYMTDKTDMGSLNFSRLNDFHSNSLSSEGMGLVRERGTDNIYWIVPHVTGNPNGPFTDYVSLYKLNFSSGTYSREIQVYPNDPRWETAHECTEKRPSPWPPQLIRCITQTYTKDTIHFEEKVSRKRLKMDQKYAGSISSRLRSSF